ncbi:MAG: CopG family transcriptional regulator [Gammaproteobacteria bacterium RIFCSPHIGHO2_12_FULL_38_11]|nr:MAG: CopG family transcriptional regulator [Gammaproteobacteria bacterium RIFCSPHIGHO2_12_FULL_38_11]
MKKRKRLYTDEPIGKLTVIEDFLPRPEDLVLRKEETAKITLSLPKNSLDFFKELAIEHHTQYQKMIRNLLVLYVAHERKYRTSKKRKQA